MKTVEKDHNIYLYVSQLLVLIIVFSLLPNSLNAKPSEKLVDLDSERNISIICEATRISIHCGYNPNKDEHDDRVCNTNDLSFRNIKSDVNRVYKVSDDKMSPDSLQCVIGKKDKIKYVIVTYSTGSTTCAQCHETKVFSTDGIQIDPKLPWQKVWLDKELPIGFSSISIEGVQTCPIQ